MYQIIVYIDSSFGLTFNRCRLLNAVFFILVCGTKLAFPALVFFGFSTCVRCIAHTAQNDISDRDNVKTPKSTTIFEDASISMGLGERIHF